MTEDARSDDEQKVYQVEFDDEALEEWDALDGSIRKQFLKKLQKLKHNPYSPGNALTGGLAGYYKIKLRDVGYRLVYSIEEDRIVIFVLAVGRRGAVKCMQKRCLGKNDPKTLKQI